MRDADILEQLGAIGILRVVAKDRPGYTLSHLHGCRWRLTQSLADLPGKLHLESAKSLAQPKIDLLESFLRAMDNEAHGALC